MNIIFYNVAWMKYYEGVTEVDRPKIGSSYLEVNEYSHEWENFKDYNEKCYGLVTFDRDIALEHYFKEATIHSENIKEVLVVLVATNDNNERRIVGWYKNAIVYREEQNIDLYTDSNFEFSYRIEALSENCYLIPEEARIFPIVRTGQLGMGESSHVWNADSSFSETGLIATVIAYIDSYSGDFINIKYTEEILNGLVSHSYKEEDMVELYDKGIRLYEESNYVEALKYLNTARAIKETPEVVYVIVECLFSLNQYNKAENVLKKAGFNDGDEDDDDDDEWE